MVPCVADFSAKLCNFSKRMLTFLQVPKHRINFDVLSNVDICINYEEVQILILWK